MSLIGIAIIIIEWHIIIRTLNININEAMNENNRNELDDDGKSSVDLHVYDLKNRINPSALKQYGISEGVSNDKGELYFVMHHCIF